MKKSTGIIRRVDDLGRIVIPIEMRKILKIDIGSALEISVRGTSIILNKYQEVSCNNCGYRVDEEDKFCKYCGKELK